MEISTGVTLPDATLLMKDADGIHSVSLADKTKGRKVIIFAVPVHLHRRVHPHMYQVLSEQKMRLQPRAWTKSFVFL